MSVGIPEPEVEELFHLRRAFKDTRHPEDVGYNGNQWLSSKEEEDNKAHVAQARATYNVAREKFNRAWKKILKTEVV